MAGLDDVDEGVVLEEDEGGVEDATAEEDVAGFEDVDAGVDEDAETEEDAEVEEDAGVDDAEEDVAATFAFAITDVPELVEADPVDDDNDEDEDDEALEDELVTTTKLETYVVNRLPPPQSDVASPAQAMLQSVLGAAIEPALKEFPQ